MARIAFNRPEVRNAFRPGTIDELTDAFRDAWMDSEVGVVPLTGNGPSPKDGVNAFCTGGDQKTGPIAIRMIKAGFNAGLDGQTGLQVLAGDATMLFYMTEEGQQGRDTFNDKREPASLSRVNVGDIAVTYLPDGGGIVVPTALYPASDDAGWDWLHTGDFGRLDEDGHLWVLQRRSDLIISPRTASGKVRRQDVRALAAHTGADDEA